MRVETLDMILRIAFYAMLSVLAYIIVPAIQTWRSSRLTKDQRETLDYWANIGVQWAKQWLQSAAGEEKKARVMQFLLAKSEELKLPYTAEDIDKAVEAVYASVKTASDPGSAGPDLLSDDRIVTEEKANDRIY